MLVVSIDGLAPRHITRTTMPTLALEGASCSTARTVTPPLTLPAHTSMLRGVDPAAHGVIDNTSATLRTDAGEWGLPSHADVDARALRSLLSPAIVEPIRAHVRAKQYRVAVEPAYHGDLSLASQMSLAEQGGPLPTEPRHLQGCYIDIDAIRSAAHLAVT